MPDAFPLVPIVGAVVGLAVYVRAIMVIFNDDKISE